MILARGSQSSPDRRAAPLRQNQGSTHPTLLRYTRGQKMFVVVFFCLKDVVENSLQPSVLFSSTTCVSAAKMEGFWKRSHVFHPVDMMLIYRTLFVEPISCRHIFVCERFYTLNKQ